ncbi:MAG TPA: hypothetical protein VLJ60_00600 [bacterium]|nr:hypothetical protein [bacterium]
MFVFPGFNSNIDHRNKKYHVQTEVNRVDEKSRINTAVYLSGMIYFSVSSELNGDDALNRESAVSTIRKQHNKVIRELISDQLSPQKSAKDKDSVDFAGMYGNDRVFSCHSKTAYGAQEIFRKLLAVPEDEKLTDNH